MSDFDRWEAELGPEITGIGRPMGELSDPELDARIDAAENALLDLELDEVASGRMTPDELAAEAELSQDLFGDDESR